MAKYVINTTREFDNAKEAARYLAELTADNHYDDWLDDLYGYIDICGMQYSAAEALKAVDPIAYDCGIDDYIEILAEEFKRELEYERPGEFEVYDEMVEKK